MCDTYKKGSYVFVEFNSPLNHRDYGLFSFNDQVIIRQFNVRKGKITLKANNDNYEDIVVTNSDKFYIIGKIL